MLGCINCHRRWGLDVRHQRDIMVFQEQDGIGSVAMYFRLDDGAQNRLRVSDSIWVRPSQPMRNGVSGVQILEP